MLTAQVHFTFRDNVQKDVMMITNRGISSFNALKFFLKNKRIPFEKRLAIYKILSLVNSRSAHSIILDAINFEKNDRLIWEITRLLIDISDKKKNDSIKPLIKIAKEAKKLSRRIIALYILGHIFNARPAVKHIVKILNDPNEDSKLRGHAAEALAYTKDKSALNSLIKGTSDASTEVRFWSAFALGQLKDKRALKALKKLVETDKSTLTGWWSVKKEASDAIKNILFKS